MSSNSRNKWLARAIILLGVVLSTIPAAAQRNLPVRVMAANLNGDSQKYEPFALRIFQGLVPDVVCIQEFNYTSTNNLGINTPAAFREMIDTAFGTNFVYFREPYPDAGDIPNGVISRYPIRNAGSWTDTQVANRGFAWAQIELPGTNDLYVVSVHFLTSSASARAIEAANLKALMQAHFPADAWIVLAGDFNAGSRTESCVTTFNGYLTDFPVPVDDLGNSDTSANRNSPHDYVLPSLSLTNYETATVFPTHTYPNGLVFDSRVYSNLSDFIPVQSADSGLAQHMAVMKDFTVAEGGTETNTPPFIITPPGDQTIAAGSNATLAVSAGGTAPLGYQWRFGGADISGANASLFTLNQVQPTNAGNYSVLVTNSMGSVTSSIAVLTVSNFPPAILVQPQSLIVNAGSSATFTVSAGGSLPLNHRWLFNGTNEPGTGTNSYTLNPARPADAGNYSVIITNIGGSITSAVAVLTVNTGATGTVTTLAGWDVNAQTGFGPSPMPPTVSVPNLTVAGLTRGNGVTTIPTAASRAWGGNGFDSIDAATAIAAGDYATFSISANAGYTISFTAISRFDYRRSGTGPPNGVLQYSIGSGAFANIATLSYPSTSSSGASLTTIDLSGIGALQNVVAGNPVTFRIVNYGASGSGGTWYIYDAANSTAPDFAVQGIVQSAPNPGSPAAAPAVLSVPAFNGSRFQMLVTGTAGSNYVVQTCTNLVPAGWISRMTNGSPFIFTDTNPVAPQQFYRAIVPP